MSTSTPVPSDPACSTAARRARLIGALPLAVLAALVGALFGLVATTMSPAPARADNDLVESSPAEGDTTSTGLTAVTLVFENELAVDPLINVVCDDDIVTNTLSIGDDGKTVTVQLTGAVPEGECRVGWTVFTEDNEQDATGTLTFDVSAAVAAAGTGATTGTSAADDAAATDAVRPASSVSSGPIWLGRVLSMLGISVLFGSLVLIVAAWPEGPEYVVALRFLRTAWIVGLVGSFIYVVALSAAVKGDSFGSGLNPSGWIDLFDAGWPGRAAVMRIVFVLASGWVVMRPERVIDPTTNMLALGIPALAVVTLGLSRTGGSLPFLGVVASLAHVFAMSVWFGGVVLLARVVLAGPGEEDLVHAVHGFCRISNPAIVVTVISGIVQLYREVGGELFTTNHGRVLLLKTIAVAAMIFVGMTARQQARARLARASELSVRTADRMRRAFGTEAAIGVVVLLLTGWLLNLTPGKQPDGSTSGYEIHRSIVDSASGLDVDVYLEPGRVGLNDLWVQVNSPAEGLSGFTLTFIPPDGSAGVVQEIPQLTGAMSAATVSGGGIPLGVAGTWQLQVDASTGTGTAQAVVTQFDVLQEDGSAADPEEVAPIPAITTTVPTGPVLTDATPATTTPDDEG